MSDPEQCLLCHILVYAANLKTDLPRLDPCDPKIRLTLEQQGEPLNYVKEQVGHASI